MDRDPITDSSPMRPVASNQRPLATYDSADDSGDDFFDHFTEATIPLPGIQSSYFNAKPKLSSPPPFTTQPTQILDTPRARRVAGESVVQVAASSPTSEPSAPSPAPALRPRIMPPPGTYFSRPPPVQRVALPILSDDPPVVTDDSSEDERSMARSNIKPSKFESGGRSGAIRVEESPQKIGFDVSRFAYNDSVPQKRPMDDIASVYANPRKKHQAQARQTGPSRARPVQQDISLDDLPDFEIRRKIERMQAVYPNKSVLELQDALAAKKGNYNDALTFIGDSEDPVIISDDELLTTPPKPVALARPLAKREVQAPNKTIQQKWSSTQTISPTTADSVAQPKRRRLVQGRRNRSPSPPSSAKAPPNQTKLMRKIESDDEEEVDSGVLTASDSEVEAVRDHTQEDRLLNFFNTCSVEDLADLSNQPEDVAHRVLASRPFDSLDDVRKVQMESQPSKTAKGKIRKTTRKPIGEKVVDVAEEMWTGYEAVDELVSKCEALGKPIATEMKKWGVDVFGAAKDGELGLTSLDDVKSEASSNRDSGIGTPTSTATTADDGEGDIVVAKTHRSKTIFLKKPSIMAADLELKDYQLVGLNWLDLLWSKRMSCILADDMGLGKTCQVIAFLSHLYETGVKGPHLIVVPGSTLENWLREFQNFSGKLVVEPYYGLQREREDQRYNIEENRSSINVIVTTYDTAYKQDDLTFIRKIIKPVVCVYDEGHVLRNSSTKRYKQLMRIPAHFRLLLTGTPLQNNLQELASILAFIMPDLFQEREEDLAYVFKHKAKTTDADHAALLSAQRIARARSMMTPFVLRRKKAQVLKYLPTKTRRVEYCELTRSQQKIYKEQLVRQQKVLEDRAAGIVNSDHTNVMMKLRQAAVHPLLFRSIYGDEKIRKIANACLKEETLNDRDPDVIYEELKLYQDYQCQALCSMYKSLSKYALKNEEWMDSGKVQKLCELLTRFKENGDRTLIFSQFTSVMDILEWVLETLGMSFFRLDGQTPIPKRQDMLDEFYSDTSIPVFMLSTKSGGAGINLACANKVIIFDSSFNPQDDIQAENRAHRVGQTREVEVIRLVTRGTIEEQIHALGISKLALDDMVAGDVTPSEGKISDADEKGIEAVEEMIMAEFRKEDSGVGSAEEDGDLKDQYLNGLKTAGLDLSAA